MAKLYPDEEPLKWICFGCKELGDKVRIPCILIVHANGHPTGCLWPGEQKRQPKWEQCND